MTDLDTLPEGATVMASETQRQFGGAGATLAEPFLRGAEVWAPDPTGEELVLLSSTHPAFTGFDELSARTQFAAGVGLPGRAWAERAPIVMATDDPAFVRADAAAAAGISAAVALPVFNGDFLFGVVVFLCGGPDLAGAIEIWQPAQANGPELVLADGYYGALDEFATVARSSAFGSGSGLPGRVWRTGMPHIIEDLGDAERFLRPAAALDAGMRVGVGLPISGSALPTVMTFLSALDTPLARWIEIWVPEDGGDALRFSSGFSNEGADLSDAYAEARVLPHHGPLGQVMATGVPLVTEYAGLDGSTHMIAVPVIADGRCRAVVALVS